MSRNKPTRGNSSTTVAGEPTAIYCRISQADDDDQTGVDRQERICREITERRGFVIDPAHVFVDTSRSAWSRKRKRPGWDRLLEDARNRGFRHIIAYHPDRAHEAAPGPGGTAPGLRRPRMAADERERLESALTRRWLDLREHLDERPRRLWLAAEARSLGYGGIGFVASVTKVAKDTISDGIKELAGQAPPPGRVRRAGAGRKRAEQVDPGLPAALDALVEPVTRGDPESPLRWTSESLNKLADELTAQGRPVSDDTVRRLLAEQGYSLQTNSKMLEGSRHADRDAQFHHINERVKSALSAGDPVISVDTKKKQLIGT